MSGDVQGLIRRFERIEKVAGVFNRARGDRCPYEAEAACVDCRAGKVHYKYAGSRSVRLYCDNPHCGVRMMA